MINKLCTPAFIYLVFSLTQIVIDTFKKEYDKASMKFIIMIIFTILLNILCEKGMTPISWLIVFIPFILMTLIITILLYVLKANYFKKNKTNVTNHNNANIPNNDITTLINN